jgi:small subunit ribosomal protein S9
MADEERQDAPKEPEAQDDEQQPVGPEEEEAARQTADPSASETAPDDAPGHETAPDDAPGHETAPDDAPVPETAPDDAPGHETAPDDAPGAEASPDDAPAASTGDAPAADGEPERPRRRDRRQDEKRDEEVIPGAHLEPDLVLEEERRLQDEYAEAGAAYAEDEEAPAEGTEADAEAQPVAHEPLDLAADARYHATGKRKTAVARVILRPGEGTYTINGRHLDQFFPRVKLQRMAQQPLETAGYHTRLDVVAKIHGGGVSAQAGALRHGIARALVEADPHLRAELKRRGFLTRDPRVKERKKAGLKKARKRPQFSKR